MFRRVLSYAGEYRRTIAASVAVMLLAVALSVLPYLFLFQLIAPLLLHRAVGFAYAAWRIAGIALCGVLYAVLYQKGLSLSHTAAYHTLKNLRQFLQRRLEQQPLGSVQDAGTGPLKKMFVDDIDSIELLLAHALPEGLSNIAVPAFVFAAMFFVDWKLALLSLCSLPLGLAAMAAMYRAGTGKVGAYYAAAQKMNATIIEYIRGMEVMKVFQKDGASYRRLEEDVRGYRDFTLAWYKVCWPWMALYNSILPCTALVVLPAGAWLVLTGASALPSLALVLCMCFGVGAPLLRALGFLAALPQIDRKIAALEDQMSAPPLAVGSAAFCGKDHTVTFENLRFSYRDAEVLHGVSFVVPEGSLTALVGESGSGKSTLGKLLVHYYDATGGRIAIGGQDIRQMSLTALNEQIAYVAQEQFLFNTSLLENIRIGRPDATDQEVLFAAERAQCGEFLQRFPRGIYTPAGEGGRQLSGGERQRIALARALLKDAPIIVLDEATAFMDPENEGKMNAAIAEVIRGKTVIVIAHRLRSVQNADQICVLQKGRLAGVGTHRALLENCPAYQTLWRAAEGSAAWGVRTAGEGGKK